MTIITIGIAIAVVGYVGEVVSNYVHGDTTEDFYKDTDF